MAKFEKHQDGYTVCDTMSHELKEDHHDLEKASSETPISSYGTFSLHEQLRTAGALPTRQTKPGPIETILMAFIASLVVVGIITGFSYLGVVLLLG